MQDNRWATPINSLGRRSVELESLRYTTLGVTVCVREEEAQRRWAIVFENTQAVKVTTFESAFEVLSQLHGAGCCFEIAQSAWKKSLGAGQREYLNKSRHLVLCCYDQVIEVVCWDVSIAGVQDSECSEGDPPCGSCR